MPNAPRAFKTPLVPLVPILGVATCLFMMVFLPLDTWIRLIVWMILGLDIYLVYGIRHSLLSANSPTTAPQANKVGGATGLILSVVLAVVAFVHHSLTPDDAGIFYFSLGFALLHIILFGVKMAKKK